MRVLFIVSALLLASCANPYAQFYQGTEDARVRPDYVPIQGQLRVHGTDDFDRDTIALIREGFVPVGQSSFSADTESVSEQELREHARKVGAHVVLVATKYTHSVSGVVPISIPQTSTSYTSGSATTYGARGPISAYGATTTTTYGSQTIMMPYSVARADFGARYFVKVRARLGIFAEPVPDEERKRIQTNTGVLVRVVMEDTPAFNSDVMPGDIVLSVGGDPIQSVPSFYRSLDKYQGTRPRFLIDRGGVRIEKEIDVLPHNADATKK